MTCKTTCMHGSTHTYKSIVFNPHGVNTNRLAIISNKEMAIIGIQLSSMVNCDVIGKVNFIP